MSIGVENVCDNERWAQCPFLVRINFIHSPRRDAEARSRKGWGLLGRLLMTSPVELGRRYFEACAGRDWAALRALLSGDVRWVFPGESSAATPAAGVEATMARIERVCSFFSGFGLTHVLAIDGP